MIEMSILRPVSERCEVRGVVGQFGPETACPFKPKFAVSVEGISPLFCCATHGKVMQKFWGLTYSVNCVKLAI